MNEARPARPASDRFPTPPPGPAGMTMQPLGTQARDGFTGTGVPYMTVGPAVTGGHPASRTGLERNMPAPYDPSGHPGRARVS